MRSLKREIVILMLLMDHICQKKLQGKISEKKTTKKQMPKSEPAYNNVPLHQIPLSLENIRFWSNICPKILNEKKKKC